METFALYVYPLGDGPHAKTFHKGAIALMEQAEQAVVSGKYQEIRGTDMRDRLVLHMKGNPTGYPRWSTEWEVLHPSIREEATE